MLAATSTFLEGHRRARTDAIAERLVETIEHDNPGYRATGVVPRTDLWRSCHDNIARVLELLADAVEQRGVDRPDHDGAYDAARETGRRRAEQGLPLDDVLRSFRIGGRLIWDDLLEHGDGVLAAGEVREIGTRLWEVVDETSAQVATSYHLHERALMRADEQQRAELWEGLLNGRAREPGFAQQAARLLDVPAAAEFLVAVAVRLDLRSAETRLSPHATAWVQRTGDAVGLVALREDRPDEALRTLREVALREGVPLGVSTVVAGLAEVDQGYLQASLGLTAQGEVPGVASFDDRLPEALLLSSPDVGRRLVDSWLGAVLALAAAESDVLLGTLEAWVASGGSTSRTAEAVHCHRNTVVNRLRRISRLTGHELTDGTVPIELDLALRGRRLCTVPGIVHRAQPRA